MGMLRQQTPLVDRSTSKEFNVRIFNENFPRNISCNVIPKAVVTGIHDEELEQKQEVEEPTANCLKTFGQSYHL